MNDLEIRELIQKAIDVRENAYAPYSDFYVGSALIDDKGDTYVGANVENASYGLTNCGERSAIFAAVSMGMKKIKAIAIVGDTTGLISPCGACRQVINEFADENTIIILSNLNYEYKVMSIDELLPHKFDL